MININTCRANDMPATVASQAVNLCWDSSQMQCVYLELAQSIKKERYDHIFISYASTAAYPIINLIGWASVGLWEYQGITRYEVQSFVHSDHRRKGLCQALITCVTHHIKHNDVPIAVFSPECYKIGKRLHWNVELFKSRDNDWISVKQTDQRF